MNNPSQLPIDTAGIAVVVIYILSLIGIALICRAVNKGETPHKFFLANRNLGFIVLLFTLYATQYSANTLLGFTGKAYRIGFSWLLTIQFFIMIIIAYTLYVPKLRELSEKYNFITPNDFLKYRYNSKLLVCISALVMLFAMGNFLTAQLMAMGHILDGVAGDQYPKLDLYLYGAIILAFIMVLYESLGGMLAVAWTDFIQGLVLLVTFFILLFLVIHMYGGLGEATDILIKREGISSDKFSVPDAGDIREWLSYLFLLGFGAALYPQAIQRIYAAKSKQSLYRGFSCMVFFPFVTTLIAVVVGVLGAAYVVGLQGAESDQIVPILMGRIMQTSSFGYWSVTIMFAGILAAMMSTADSLLLSIVSILTIDIYKEFINPNASDKSLAILGKVISWVLISFLVWVAVQLRDTTLIQLLERKFDILIQLLPAIIIGINWPGLRTGPVILGLVAGLICALCLAFGVEGRVYDIHPGLYGLALNLLIAVGGSVWVNSQITIVKKVAD